MTKLFLICISCKLLSIKNRLHIQSSILFQSTIAKQSMVSWYVLQAALLITSTQSVAALLRAQTARSSATTQHFHETRQSRTNRQVFTHVARCQNHHIANQLLIYLHSHIGRPITAPRAAQLGIRVVALTGWHHDLSSHLLLLYFDEAI